MRRNMVLLIGGGVALLIAVAAAVLIFLVPEGRGSAHEATLAHVRADADTGSEEVLASQAWGDGELVLVGYNHEGVRRLGVAFASSGFLGWRVSSYTEDSVEPDDVVIGSLLVARSQGNGGQPAWSAAVGELLDDRIDRVEIRWANDQTSVGPRVENAYLVVQEGSTTAIEARYLSDEGVEIATVPVGSPE